MGERVMDSLMPTPGSEKNLREETLEPHCGGRGLHQEEKAREERYENTNIEIGFKDF